MRSCPSCGQLFALPPTHGKKQAKNHTPLLLPCHHSICENCLRNTIKFLEPIECKTCNEKLDLSKVEMKNVLSNVKIFRQKFPMDFYLCGQLVCQQMEEKEDTKKAEFADYYIDVKSILESKDKPAACVECNRVTDKICEQCNTRLCEKCFNKIHKDFQCLKNHTFTVVQSEVDKLLSPVYCTIHNNQKMDMYCTDCSKSICMECLMFGDDVLCKNHNVVCAETRNIDIAAEIKDMVPTMMENLCRLTNSALEVGNLLKDFDNDQSEVGKIINNVKKYCAKACGAVQAAELDTMAQLENLQSSERNSLMDIKKQVILNIENAQKTLNAVQSATNAGTAKVSLQGLLERAKEIEQVPWFLKTNEKKNDITLTVDEEICEKIKDYIKLNVNEPISYCLLATKDIEEGVPIPPAPKKVVFPPEVPRDVRESIRAVASNSKATRDNCDPSLKNYNSRQFKNAQLDSQNFQSRESQKFQPRELQNFQLYESLKFQPRNTLNPPLSENYPAHNSQNYASRDFQNHDSFNFYNLYPVKKYQSHDKSFQSHDVRKFQFGSNSSISSAGSDRSSYRKMKQKAIAARQEMHKIEPLTAGSEELIFISHIIDPNHFYVHRVCQKDSVKDVIKEFKNATCLPTPTIENVEEGKMFLAYNEMDKDWLRCRITKVDKTDSESPVYTIFFIDFGTTDTVSRDKLRVIPSCRTRLPTALALRCSLGNCRPPLGTEWTSDAALLLLKIVHNKKVIMQVREVTSCADGDQYEVDLFTSEGESLAQALAFHEQASLIDPDLEYPIMKRLCQKQEYIFSKFEFIVGTRYNVYITHVVSPDKFYITKASFQDTLSKMTADLNKEYSRNKEAIIHCPIAGMVCAAQTGAGFRRARVEEALRGRRVRVLLPDSGERLVVPREALRRLRSVHLSISALAVPCELAGVTAIGDSWGPLAIQFLQNYQGILLSARPEGTPDGTLSVTLFDNSDINNEININKELITKKLAVTVGMSYLTTPVTLKKRVIKQDEDEGAKAIAKDEEPEKNFKLEVKVLSVESPSLIYVALTDQEDKMDKLFDELQKFYYRHKGQTKNHWTVGEKCVSLCQRSRTYRRAVILELTEQSAKVFFVDFACVEEVPLGKLVLLEPEFTKLNNAAIKCHLSGVCPAGEEWPSVTNEWLKDEIKRYRRMFITRNGDIEDKSLPVELWVFHVTCGGALEPDIREWRCLNYMLIKRGLAVSDKVKEHNDNDDEESEYLKMCEHMNNALELDNDDTLEEDSGFKWLPPEPFTSTEFTALGTYVDDDCVIYLHDVTKEETFDFIQETIDKLYTNESHRKVHKNWNVGECCIALYCLDKMFYRATVLEVHPKESSCLVEFVDYGSQETVAFEDMIKATPLTDLPIQAHRCFLPNIRPAATKWLTDVLDYIHSITVDKKLLIEVLGDSVDGKVPIRLKLENKMYLDTILLDSEAVVAINENDAVEEETNSENAIEEISPDLSSTDMVNKSWNQLMAEEEHSEESNDSYPTFPKFKIDTDEFRCTVAIVNSFDIIYMIPEPKELIKKAYENMTSDLQVTAQNMSQLNGLYENKACMTLFNGDNKWGRTSIMGWNEHKTIVKVLFIDFGNIEDVAIDSIKEIDPMWVYFPPTAIPARLYGVQINEDVDVLKIIDDYGLMFLKAPFHAKVIKRDEQCVYVECRDDEGDLLYEHFLANNVFIKCGEDMS